MPLVLRRILYDSACLIVFSVTYPSPLLAAKVLKIVALKNIKADNHTIYIDLYLVSEFQVHRLPAKALLSQT